MEYLIKAQAKGRQKPYRKHSVLINPKLGCDLLQDLAYPRNTLCLDPDPHVDFFIWSIYATNLSVCVTFPFYLTHRGRILIYQPSAMNSKLFSLKLRFPHFPLLILNLIRNQLIGQQIKRCLKSRPDIIFCPLTLIMGKSKLHGNDMQEMWKRANFFFFFFGNPCASEAKRESEK